MIIAKLGRNSFILLALAMAAAAPAADPVVRDVSWVARDLMFPGDAFTLVDVTFTIEDADGDLCWLDFWGHDDAVDTTGTKSATKPIFREMRTFFPIGGSFRLENQRFSSGTHTVTWVASADIDERAPIDATSFQVYVRASDQGRIAPGRYRVIDISGGPSATSYPVDDAENVAVNLDEYKTTKIVLRELPDGAWMGVYEVTQRQYELVTGLTPSGFSGNPKYPVEYVSWQDVTDSGNYGSGFIRLLRNRTGQVGLDLPDEVTWEYACRAGTTANYADYEVGGTLGGDAEANLAQLGWYRSNSGLLLHDTGLKRPNSWGLHDLHGSIWESTSTGSPAERVFRGGSWNSTGDICLSGYRSVTVPDGRYLSDGFRLALPNETASSAIGGIHGAASSRASLNALGFPVVLPEEAFQDFDENSIPDAFEDFDGDGVPDAFEDNDGDGNPDTLDDFDGDGTLEAFQDFDNDGAPDAFEDNNSDGIPDGFADSDLDGMHDFWADANANDVPDSFESFQPIRSSTHPAFVYAYAQAEFRATWPNYQPDNTGGFLHRIDQAPVTPLTLANGTYTAERSVSWPVPANGVWYLHLVALDAELQPMPQTQIRFAFRAQPLGPIITSPSHPQSAVPSLYRDFQANLAYTPGSYVRFYYLVDQLANTTPSTSDRMTTANTFTVADNPLGWNWLHLVAEDRRGVLTSPVHYGFIVTTRPPVVTSSTHPEQGSEYPHDARFTLAPPAGMPLEDLVRYYWRIDLEPVTNPDTEDDSLVGPELIVENLPLGANYLHVRHEDKYGYLSPTAHYRVNVREAVGPTATSSTHPDPTQSYTPTNASFAWTDAESVHVLYYHTLDTSPDSIPDPATARRTASRAATYVALAEGTHWFHLRGEDRFGNLSQTTHFRINVISGGIGVTPTPTPIPSIRTKEKVIIVAGGGRYPGNAIAEQTAALARFAHGVCTLRGIPAENVLYLSAFETGGNVDGAATLEALQSGISPWANDARKLTVFLLDHGERAPGGADWLFLLDATRSPRVTLSAHLFDDWLDAVQAGPDPLRDVAVVVDMCYAGGFIDACQGSPAGTRRLLIASTRNDRLASFGGAVGSLSFSHYFLTQALTGADFQNAWRVANSVMVNLRTPRDAPQVPLLDDDGDGVSTALDGLVALNWRLGTAPSFGALPPELLTAKGSETIPTPRDYELWCQLGPGDSGEVRAFVAFEDPPSGPTDPVTGYTEVTLNPDPVTPGRWTGTLSNTAIRYAGSYSILYTAEELQTDTGQILTAIPISRDLIVTTGEALPNTPDVWAIH